MRNITVKVAILVTISLTILGIYSAPSLHEDLKSISKSKLMKINGLRSGVIKEINCERYSEHSENFVTHMIEKFGVDAVESVATTDFAKSSVQLFILNEKKIEIEQSKLEIQANLKKIELLDPSKLKIKEVKPVEVVKGYVYGGRSEREGVYVNFFSYNKFMEYQDFERRINRENVIECKVDEYSSSCLGQYEIDILLDEKRSSLGKYIFIEDGAGFPERSATRVVLISAAYDHRDVYGQRNIDSYVLPFSNSDIYEAEGKRNIEREVQAKKHKIVIRDNLNKIRSLKEANNIIWANIRKLESEVSQMKL